MNPLLPCSFEPVAAAAAAAATAAAPLSSKGRIVLRSVRARAYVYVFNVRMGKMVGIFRILWYSYWCSDTVKVRLK